MSPRGQPGGWPVLAVLTAVLMFSLIELVVRHLLERYPLHQVVWLRSAAAIPVLALTLWALSHRASAAAPNAAVMPWHQRWLLHLLRSGLGTLSMACIFYAVGQIPLGTAAALTATAPFFVLLMSPYLLGEPVPWQRWAGVAVGFLGVCLVSGPQGQCAVGRHVFGRADGLVALLGPTRTHHPNRPVQRLGHHRMVHAGGVALGVHATSVA